MASTSEICRPSPENPPPVIFPTKDIPLEERIVLYREHFAIDGTPAVFLDTRKPIERLRTINAGEWQYTANPEGLLPFYKGEVHTFEEAFIKALGTEQTKFQLPEEGHDEVHARAIHFAKRNWPYLIRKQYENDPGQEEDLPCLTELKFVNEQRADIVGLGPDGRIFVDDISCSRSPHTRYDKFKKIRNNYVIQIQQAYKRVFGMEIDPELIVPRVIHFDLDSLPEVNNITIYTVTDFESYIIEEEKIRNQEHIEMVA